MDMEETKWLHNMKDDLRPQHRCMKDVLRPQHRCMKDVCKRIDYI
jgi:hypothetical protein